MSRRRSLMGNKFEGGYVKSGLKVWIDGILNKNSNQIIDQTGNYSATILDGNFQKNNNYIYLLNNRFLFPCGAALENNITISVTYRRRSNGTGIIWSLTNPSQYLSGIISTGHIPNFYQYLRVNGIGDTGAFIKDSTDIHTVDVVINKTIGVADIYVGGILTNHVFGNFNNTKGTLSLIVGGYMNSDKMMEYGELYSLKLYNRALSFEELQQNYKIDKERFKF